MFVCPFRKFDIEGVTEPQLGVKGQGVEPGWSTQLSPDSACSEGSAGSVEQPQDAGQSVSAQVGCDWWTPA